MLLMLVCTKYVAPLTSRCRRYHLARVTRDSFAASADPPFLSPHFGSLSSGDFQKSRKFTSHGIGRNHEKHLSSTSYSAPPRRKKSASVPLTLFSVCLPLDSHCRPYVQIRRVATQVICCCTPQWFLRLGLASQRPDLVVVLAGWSPVVVACPLARPRLGLASRRSRLCGYGSSFRLHLSALKLLRCLLVERQQFALAQRSPVPVCPKYRAYRHGVSRSPGRYRFGGFFGGLFWRTSPGTAAPGHRRSCGRPVSLADSVAETCTTTTRL